MKTIFGLNLRRFTWIIQTKKFKYISNYSKTIIF